MGLPALALPVLLPFAIALANEGTVQIAGHFWEDGGFPPSDVGDELYFVGVVNGVDAPFSWEPTVHSYTVWARGMVSLGTTDYGLVQITEYSGGELSIHVDGLPSNHSYGVFPPNETAPSTFTDGTSVYLEGTFTNMLIVVPEGSPPTALGSVDLTGGDALPDVLCPLGWTLFMNIAYVVPQGYDASGNGELAWIHLHGGPCAGLPVEPTPWGRIKSLYR